MMSKETRGEEGKTTSESAMLGLGFRVWGYLRKRNAGLRVQGLGLTSESAMLGLGFRV